MYDINEFVFAIKKELDKKENNNVIDKYNLINTSMNILIEELCKKYNFDKEMYVELLSNPDKRIEFITEFKRNNNNERAIYYIEAYIYLEKKLIDINKEIDEKINSYETACGSISVGKISDKNMTLYVNCIEEAWNNYINKRLMEKCKITMPGMAKSIYSIDKNGNKIKNSTQRIVQIRYDNLPHLLGLPNPNSDDFIAKKYAEYKKQKNIKINNAKEDIEEYMNFIINNGKKIYMEAIKSGNISVDKIEKSFEKAINFSKVLAFRRIPEISLDYEPAKSVHSRDSELNIKNHVYSTQTNAFTPHVPDSSKISIKEYFHYFTTNKTSPDKRIVALDNTLDKSFDRSKVYINVKKFPTGNKKAKDNGDENEIYFMYEDKQYKYLVDSDCYNSDDKPNLFLLSYNTNAIMFDETIASLYLHKAFIALAYYIADDLKNSIPKDTVSNTKIMFKGIERTQIKILRSIDKCINYLFKYLKASKNDEYIPKLEDMHDIYNIITLRDKKRNHLLNVERLATMVSYFINNEITEEDKQIINSIQFPIVKRKNKNAKNEYIDSKEFEEIKELKSFIAYYIRKKSINAIIKRDFGTESYPDEKQYSQPLFNLLQFLAIKGFENDKEKAKLRNRYYSQQIGLIGFFESENQEKKYTKTFLGKNPFQLLCDLRICSHCFKIETIVEKDKIITSGLNKDGLRKLKELEKKIKNEKTNLKLNTKLDLLSDENKIIKFKLPNGMAASPIPIPFTIPVFIATSFVWISKKIYKEWVKNNKRLNDVPYKDGDNVTINYIINDKTISKLDIAKRLGVQPNEIVIVDDLENKNVGDVINIIVYNDYFVDKYNYKYDKSVDFELSYVFKDEKNYTTAAFDLLSEHSILKEIFSVYNNPIGELKKLLILQNEDNYSDTIYLNLKITKEIADKYGMDYNNNSTKKK